MTPEAQIIEALLQIPNKQGEDVNFELNTAQRKLDANLTGRDLVPKARQEGVSSYFLANFLVSCLMYRNTRAVVISHDMESTQRLLSRVRYFIEHIRGPAPVVSNMSKNEIVFPKMNSMFYLGTAGSRKFGRGDTITHLLCSEYAFWPDAKDLMVGLLQAVPMSGRVVVESTGNGFNDYYRRCMKAYRGGSIWKVHFLPWHDFPEYRLPLSQQEEELVLRNLQEEWEEPELVNRGLTADRIAWRRMKLDELDYDLAAFKQEYPMTLEECFQMTSESVFHKVLYEPTDLWKLREPGYWTLEGHPSRICSYVLGADVAAGVNKDSSAIEVFCLNTGEQVAEYVSNKIDPEAFANKIERIGKAFNTAYSVVESNNHGILTLARLREVYPASRLYKERTASKHKKKEARLHDLGHRTTAKSHFLMLGLLRTMLAHEWTIHSPLLKSQLTTFIEHENGKLAAQQGCDDDAVFAAAHAAFGAERAGLACAPRPERQTPVENDPLNFGAVIKELRSRGQEWPIRPQEAWN